MEDGLVVNTPDGRSILAEKGVDDSGAEEPITTEVACKEWGLSIDTSRKAFLRGIDGLLTALVLGRTQPFSLTLRKGCFGSVNLLLPDGAIVLKGDAAGLYQIILDKQTLHSVYGHVDPAYERLVFRPFADQGYAYILNGVPVASVASGKQVKDLRSQGLLGPSAAAGVAMVACAAEDSAAEDTSGSQAADDCLPSVTAEESAVEDTAGSLTADDPPLPETAEETSLPAAEDPHPQAQWMTLSSCQQQRSRTL